MKNKVVKTFWLSLIALGAPISLSANIKPISYSNHNHTHVLSSPNLNLPSNSTNEVIDVKLEEDTTFYDAYLYSNTTYNLDLNGHVLTSGSGICFCLRGDNSVLNIYDSNPTSVHHYRVEEDGHWTITENVNDPIVYGGIIKPRLVDRGLIEVDLNSQGGTEDDAHAEVNINGGTLCGVTDDPVIYANCDGHRSATITLGGTAAIRGNHATSASYSRAAVFLEADDTTAITFNFKNGVISDNTSDGKGQIYLIHSNFNMTGGTISNNTSSGDAGAIYTFNTCEVNISGGTISNNTSGGNGGAIYMSAASTLNVSGGTITKNESHHEAAEVNEYGGGAIFSYSSTVNVLGGIISENKAISDGGAIYLYQSPINVYGGTITQNETKRNGGAIYSSRYSKKSIKIYGGTISYNKAERLGGGICTDINDEPDFYMGGGLITHNTAGSRGGGMIIQDFRSCLIEGGEISYNVANSRGGGIVLSPSAHIEIPEGKEFRVVGNKAKNENEDGGGVYISSGGAFISGKIIIKDNVIDGTNGERESNLFFAFDPLQITGPLTGSDIHFWYQRNGASTTVAFRGFEKSGSKHGMVNEFFHVDNKDDVDYYTKLMPTSGSEELDVHFLYNNTGNVLVPINTYCDSKEGKIFVSYENAPVGEKVVVEVEPVGEHSVKTLTYNGVDVPYEDGVYSFIVPDDNISNVLVRATFKHNDVSTIKGKPATCFEDGWKDYYQCNDCGKYFADKAANEQIEDIEAWKVGEGKIPQLVHDIHFVAGKEPTCGEDGYKSYYQCSHCDTCYEDEEGLIPIPNIEEWKKGQGKIPHSKHKHISQVRGQAPTTFNDGWKDYYQCDECQHCFEDAKGLVAINDINVWKTHQGALRATFFNLAFISSLIGCAGVIGVVVLYLLISTMIKKRRCVFASNNYQEMFTDITYQKKTLSRIDDLDTYLVKFNYKGVEIPYLIHTRKGERTNIEAIKKRFDTLMKSGRVGPYADEYINKHYRRRIVLLAILSIAFIFLAVVAIFLSII